jgi:hypothetical protein
MRLVLYQCDKCKKQQEELYYDTEDQLELLEITCECGGEFKKFNFKNNSHRVRIMDSHLGK